MRRRIGNRIRSRCQMKRMSFMAQLATCLTIRRFAQTFVIGLRKPSVEGGL